MCRSPCVGVDKSSASPAWIERQTGADRTLLACLAPSGRRDPVASDGHTPGLGAGACWTSGVVHTPEARQRGASVLEFSLAENLAFTTNESRTLVRWLFPRATVSQGKRSSGRSFVSRGALRNPRLGPVGGNHKKGRIAREVGATRLLHCPPSPPRRTRVGASVASPVGWWRYATEARPCASCRSELTRFAALSERILGIYEGESSASTTPTSQRGLLGNRDDRRGSAAALGRRTASDEVAT